LADLGEKPVLRNVPFGVSISLSMKQIGTNESSILLDSAIYD
jgi:hypothetical protein